ncbi:hypothetical protein DPQ33_13385 [Oceanidesulfovibrio indonesiensis]|uniref:Uncharacterized protein n=1 Tax=Oceanidesulfovibrio indonesiensis TaxID=54767 RepID=A0A7M3MCB6_9BACT|nr:hypothetical protein [Oceanidesulfovibrio indonesiensis]TVM15957.1 hypothetical protein DPQ33_13385 [Oceanidesulfovibrio indonesiensis]
MRALRMIPLLVCLLILCAGPAAATSTASEDTFKLEEGFQGYPWGVTPDELEGFQKIGTKNNADFYVCICVTYLIEDISVPQVVYGFVDNKLYGVFIDIEDQSVFDKLLAYITKTYGEPRVKEEASEIVHRWNVGDVKIKLKDDLAKGDRKLSFYYSPLSRQVELSPFRKTDPEDEPRPMSWTPPTGKQKPVSIPLLSF